MGINPHYRFKSQKNMTLPTRHRPPRWKLDKGRQWTLDLIEPEWRIWASVNCTTTGSDNGLSPGRRQAIILTNAGILLTGPLATKLSEILFQIRMFSFKKMHLKMSPGKWRPPFSASIVKWFAYWSRALMGDKHWLARNGGGVGMGLILWIYPRLGMKKLMGLINGNRPDVK